MTPNLVAILGPTGCGKSALAESVAGAIDAQLLNADAFQVYRGMDVGTNKPLDKSQYELLDLVDPCEGFGVGQWISRALPILNDLWEKRRNVVVVGGTGLYVRALFEEYQDMNTLPDMKLRQELMNQEESLGLDSLVVRLKSLDPNTKVDLRNGVRVRRAIEKLENTKENIKIRLPDYKKTKLILKIDPSYLDIRLKERVTMMFDNGWPKEVENLLGTGVPVSAPGFRAIGYQSVAQYLRGELSRLETEETIYLRTRQYAKRQRTWLRSEPNVVEIDMNHGFAIDQDKVLDHAISEIHG